MRHELTRFSDGSNKPSHWLQLIFQENVFGKYGFVSHLSDNHEHSGTKVRLRSVLILVADEKIRKEDKPKKIFGMEKIIIFFYKFEMKKLFSEINMGMVEKFRVKNAELRTID